MLRMLAALMALALCACSNPGKRAFQLAGEAGKEMEANNYRNAVAKF